MPPMPAWTAKPAEFYLFDQYFSAVDQKVLQARLQNAITTINDDGTDGGHDDLFWDDPANGDLKLAKQHFDDHWLSSSYFGPTGEAMMRMFRLGVRKAAETAREPVKRGGDAKPLHLSWVCAPEQVMIGIGVTDGPNAVSITITTPPFRRDQIDPASQSYRVDRAWSWKLEGTNVVSTDDQVAVLNDLIETVGDDYVLPGSTG